MKRTWIAFALVTGMVVLAGCQRESSKPEASGPTVDGEKFLLNTEPDGAEDVITAREAAKDDEDIVVVGRIGGRENPWNENRAAFTIVDGSLKACSDIPGDHCPKPWDYCCQTHKLPTSTALVKVVDEQGDLVNVDARELLNLKELSTVVVKGKAKRDDAGNLTILASGVYVKSPESKVESREKQE